MRITVVFLLVSAPFPTGTLARTWSDISSYHGTRISDPSLDDLTVEVEPLLVTMSPSMAPSDSPSFSPTTLVPSQIPSSVPTITPQPSTMPSHSPSLTPTALPSGAPSAVPTSSPTRDEFAPNPVPSDPPPGYFNYDYRRSSAYGPGYPKVVYHNASMNKVQYSNNGWANVTILNNNYWNEFDDDGFGAWQGVLSKHTPSRNHCSNIGEQSPIDIRPTGAKCLEHHQIRSQPGHLLISNNTETTKLIESNKLRLVYSRRPCQNYLLPECAEPNPPNGDFPNNWGGYADVMHVDWKVPSEHTIYGERFDGEMQIFHIHPVRRLTPAVSVMMQASFNAYNFQLQTILDEFQAVYDDHGALCAEKTRRERRLVSMMHRILGQGVESDFHDYETWADFSTRRDNPNTRKLQSGIWHPHHIELVPSIYFFGYNGSITEPPCGEWVAWRVIDTPMKLHVRQLEQLKRLIFTHVSPDCEKTGVQYGESVARPIQDSFRRDVFQCTSNEYPADSDRMNQAM